MNSGRKVIQIVDDMMPLQISNNLFTVMGGKKKIKSLIVHDGGANASYGIGDSEPVLTNHSSNLRTVLPKCFTTLGGVLNANKQFSSTTIVNGADTEANAGITTFHIPVLGLEPTTTIDVPSCGTYPLSVETLEIPVETILTESDDIQTIHVGECTSLGSSSDVQPMVIASTDSQGNCFVALQDNPVLNPSTAWKSRKENIVKPECTSSTQSLVRTTSRTISQAISQVPTVTKVVNNRHNIGTRHFLRCGRSRMIADQITNIPVAEFKSQLNDTSDIIGKLDLAPSTKRRMNHLQWKGIGKLFASPGQKIFSTKISKLFTRHLRTCLLPTEETFSDMKLLPVGYKPEVDPTKIKRITRRRRYPEAEEYQRRMLQEQMQQTIQNLVADNQTEIQTVFLENSESFKNEPQDNLQVLVEAAENGAYTQSDSSRVVDMYSNDEMGDGSIIVIHDEQEANQGAAYSQQNIEVLLAAAESGYNGENIHQVFICQPDSGSQSVLHGTSSIIIVPNNTITDPLSETVIGT